MRKLLLGFAAAAALGLGAAEAADETHLIPEHWSFEGATGTYNRAELQRGFQVYKEVCSACHPVTHLHYRDLGPGGIGGGIGFNEDEVKALASQVQVTDGPNDQGEMFERPGRPADPIARPFPNEKAARAANNGALPPDLSLIVKAREGGPQYVFSILNGYKQPPADVKLAPGMNYNEYFTAGGHQIAMPQPLTDGAVTYADGTPNTLQQEAHDVVAFLSWASEPNLDMRHRIGVKVFLFLALTTIVFYFAKRRIWARVH